MSLLFFEVCSCLAGKKGRGVGEKGQGSQASQVTFQKMRCQLAGMNELKEVDPADPTSFLVNLRFRTFVHGLHFSKEPLEARHGEVGVCILGRGVITQFPVLLNLTYL